MTDIEAQNKGLGSFIISELCKVMTGMGMRAVRLGWVKGNPQAEHFWKKNGFVETGATNETDKYTVVVKPLKGIAVMSNHTMNLTPSTFKMIREGKEKYLWRR